MLAWGQSRAVNLPGDRARAEGCLRWSASKRYVRELTGNNDGPEIDAWERAVGVALHSAWCGCFQAANQRANGLPMPAGAGGSYNWFLGNSPRTYFIAGIRGSLDSLRPGHKVGFYSSKLGRIGHIGEATAPSRAVRKGRPARGWWIRAGNTGIGGGRDGAGVHDNFYPNYELYALSNWLH